MLKCFFRPKWFLLSREPTEFTAHWILRFDFDSGQTTAQSDLISDDRCRWICNIGNTPEGRTKSFRTLIIMIMSCLFPAQISDRCVWCAFVCVEDRATEHFVFIYAAMATDWSFTMRACTRASRQHSIFAVVFSVFEIHQFYSQTDFYWYYLMAVYNKYRNINFFVGLFCLFCLCVCQSTLCDAEYYCRAIEIDAKLRTYCANPGDKSIRNGSEIYYLLGRGFLMVIFALRLTFLYILHSESKWSGECEDVVVSRIAICSVSWFDTKQGISFAWKTRNSTKLDEFMVKLYQKFIHNYGKIV